LVDPRVAELALAFIDRRVFEIDLDARRTAERVPRAVPEMIKSVPGDADCHGSTGREGRCRRSGGTHQ
jgi:hypothetical protein